PIAVASYLGKNGKTIFKTVYGYNKYLKDKIIDFFNLKISKNLYQIEFEEYSKIKNGGNYLLYLYNKAQNDNEVKKELWKYILQCNDLKKNKNYQLLLLENEKSYQDKKQKNLLGTNSDQYEITEVNLMQIITNFNFF